MVEVSEPSRFASAAGAPAVLVAAARGRGGVAEVVERVVPYLPAAACADVSSLPKVLARVARDRYDVLHLHPSLRWRACARDSALASVAWARGRRVLAQWHGWDESLSERPLWAARLLDAHHAVITDTQRRKLVEWGVDDARISAVNNPYDPESLPSPQDRPPQGEPKRAVFLGRWVEDKGIDLLIGALGELPELFCEIAGEGPARASMGAAILRHRCSDRVTLTGWLDASGRRALWSRASVLVLPSASEGQPLAVVEALAAGVPVVACSSGDIPRLIEGAGQLVPRSIEGVAAGIRAVLSEPPRGLACVQARVLAEHHPREVARRWAEIYRQVAEP